MTNPNESNEQALIDALAQEIRRLDGSNHLGAGALAEKLIPFIQASIATPQPQLRRSVLEETLSLCQNIRAPKNYNQAEKHAWDMAATEYWKAIRALIEPLSAATGWQGENALLTKEKPNELISALKQAYLVIYKLYEHYDSSEKAYGFAETLATIDKALANYATHSGVAVQEPEITRQQIEKFAKLMSYSIEEAYDTYSLLREALGKPLAPTLDKE